jgi:hypothetical protein
MCIKYTDNYSCGHVYASKTVRCFGGRDCIIEHRAGKQMHRNCARLACRSEWKFTRYDDYEYEYRSESKTVTVRDCGMDFGFRDSRRRGHGRLDMDRNHRWVEVGDGYIAAGHSKKTVRIGSPVERFFAAIMDH